MSALHIILDNLPSNLVHGFVWRMTSRRVKIPPKSGRGLGHVTPTISGSTVGYPSDSLASCYLCGRWNLITNWYQIRRTIGSRNVTTFAVHGHVTSSFTWPFDSQVVISYRCSIGTKSIYPTVVEIMGPKYIGVMTLTFLGHVTSSVTGPSNLNGAIFYCWSIETKSLSPAVFEILGPKHSGVTTLTFLGHVFSSVMWLFDSQVAISYRCSTGIKWVSPTVVEIMGPEYIGIMTLTFLGHVTSSVTWPFESQ